jgi:glyoxylase-like metal-dependent hydrolase (beta-lactamase superfamily II)
VKIGDVELFLVSDGCFRLDGGAMFGVVPKVLWERVATPDALNRVPMALNCLVIRSSGKTILVETGLGSKQTSKQREILAREVHDGGLLASLHDIGVAAEDVDIVINTHLHSDHCGGNTMEHNGRIAVTFPRAEYWIQRREWADACYPNERTRSAYDSANLLALAEGGQLRLLAGDTRVTNEVQCVVTRGHTQAHQSVVIESAGQLAVFLGDLAPTAAHLKRLEWNTAYDTEPLETIESKRSMQEWLVERDALVILYHDSMAPSGRLSQLSGTFHFRP